MHLLFQVSSIPLIWISVLTINLTQLAANNLPENALATQDLALQRIHLTKYN